MKRPSGAELLRAVVKRGMDPVDASLQRVFMEKAGALSIPILGKLTDGYVMAMGADLPPTMYAQLYQTFERLWAIPSPRRPVFPEAYLAYVKERAITCTRPIVTFACEMLFGLPVPEGRYRTWFTHGDANLSNALLYEGTVRLIDFSPKPTPSDCAIDQAKLLLSAAGFDNDQPAQALRDLRKEWRDGWDLVNDEPRIYDPRLKFYYLSHIIRVASRDPRHDEFFFKALRNHCV